jgi:hypothetical protein
VGANEAGNTTAGAKRRLRACESIPNQLPVNGQNPADLKIRSTPVDLTTQLKLHDKTPSFIDRYFG